MPEHPEPVYVRAEHVHIALLQKPQCPFAHLLPVKAGKRRQVHLESRPHILQTVIVAVVHVRIPLGMGEYRKISFRLDSFHDSEQIHRRIEIRGFDQKTVAFKSPRQQLALRKAFLEQPVQHVFRSKAQGDVTFIYIAQLCKTLFQNGRCIGHILHYMWCQPYRNDSGPFIQSQYLQGLVHSPHTVVHTRKYVRMAVGKAAEHSAFLKREMSSESPHGRLNYFWT